MPKPAPARLDPTNYPVAIEVQTRFQDLDPLGHINNGAMAAIIETGRIAFNHQVGVDGRDRKPGERWLIARLEINYVAEGHYPNPSRSATASTVSVRRAGISSRACSRATPASPPPTARSS